MKKFDGYLLVSDMDGTLLNSKSEISKENKEAIKYFVDNGGVFTIATGRMRESVRGYIKDLPIGLPIIIYNGARIYDFSKEEAIHDDFLIEERKQIVRNLKAKYPKLGIEVFSDEVNYIMSECRFTNRLSTSVCEIVFDIDEEVWNKKWTKILIIGEEDEIIELEENFKEISEDAIPIKSGANFLEVIPENTSKGTALNSLIEDYNIDKEKVIAVGDNMNDMELLKFAKYGFGIENGDTRLVESAKYKAPSNNDHPIAHIVKWIEENI